VTIPAAPSSHPTQELLPVHEPSLLADPLPPNLDLGPLESAPYAVNAVLDADGTTAPLTLAGTFTDGTDIFCASDGSGYNPYASDTVTSCNAFGCN
jgi:hypothetical protein